MTNKGYSQSTSSFFSTGSTSYYHWTYAWVRGAANAIKGGGGIYLVAHYYDTSEEWIGQETVWFSDGYQDKNWQQIISSLMNLPEETVSMRLQLVNAFVVG